MSVALETMGNSISWDINIAASFTKIQRRLKEEGYVDGDTRCWNIVSIYNLKIEMSFVWHDGGEEGCLSVCDIEDDIQEKQPSQQGS